ncbi:MAG: hypothetical protein WC471_05935 [Candidatus Woesearchaeota archaeon]|jgi:hypothetical protein
MTFVRTKSIKGKNYAYLVENIWTANGPRQKAKKYLGRVYNHRRETEIPFAEFYRDYDVKTRSKKELLCDAIRLELANHGFKEENMIWSNKGSFIDLKRLKFFNDRGNEVAIGLNEGILCKPLITKILKHQVIDGKEAPDKEGYSLAKLLVEAGLKIEPEVFVRLYELSKV